MEKGESNRGVAASEAKWEFQATFRREEVAVLAPGAHRLQWCGLVAGYPAGLQLERRTDDGDETLGVFLHFYMSEYESLAQGVPRGGVLLKVNWLLPPNCDWNFNMFVRTGISRGWRNVFFKPWAEAVREGSPHFPNGKLEVKLTVKLAVKE